MKRILVVDDESNVRRVLSLYLERAGYAVTACCNGQEALAAIDDGAPDALVTDIRMPEMTGKDLCLALNNRFPDRTFPIFIMTSMTDLEHRQWTAGIQNLEFLEKPLSMRLLVLKLAKCFSPGAATGDRARV